MSVMLFPRFRKKFFLEKKSHFLFFSEFDVNSEIKETCNTCKIYKTVKL